MRGALIALAALPALAGCAVSVGDRAAPAPVAAPQPLKVGKAFQWEHGSGEAAVLSRQTFGAMATYAIAAAQARPAASVILAAGATPDAPRWTACAPESKPAVVLDMDETSILNTGANYDSVVHGEPAFDAARWAEWERDSAAYVEPVPGSVEAIARLRAAGITPIFISNRVVAYQDAAVTALANAGLGQAVPGETMFLRTGEPSAKDPRRAAVAAKWCVVAMVGDQLGDFSDTFNIRGVQARRALAQSPAVAGKWGQGWFLLANPMYGPGVTGTVDDLFPADKRWPQPSTKDAR